MKTAMIWSALTPLTLLILSGCSSMGAGPGTVLIEAVSLTAQASLVPLAAGKVYCPPFYNSPCGSYAAQGRPRMGGDIIPALTFSGDKTIGSSLGQSFTAQFPLSGYTQFYVNTLLLDVAALDKSLLGAKLNFALESSNMDPKGVYTFIYVSQ